MANLFKKPETPVIPDPAPLPDQKQTAMAKRKLVAREMKGTGVQSTVLTGNRETLGA